jgi:hypothetical protein
MSELLMRMALEWFEGSFRIGGRRIPNLRYVDDIVLIASCKQEVVSRSATQIGMKINAVKTKVMAVNAISDKVGTMVVRIMVYECTTFTRFVSYHNFF